MTHEFKPRVERLLIPTVLWNFIVFLFLVFMYALFTFGSQFWKSEIRPPTSEAETLLNIIVFQITPLLWNILVFVICAAFIFLIVDRVGTILTLKYKLGHEFISIKKILLSDLEENIPVKNITDVSYSVDWFLDRIFGTGTVSIHTSGTANSDISLRAVYKPAEVYDELKSLIDPTRPKEVREEIKSTTLLKALKPNTSIAVLDNMIRGISTLVVLYIALSVNLGPWGILGGFVLLLIYLVVLILTYKKMNYEFFDDRLEYYDGFLIKHRRTIPIERITDVDLNAGIVERFFGVSIITVQTAGGSKSRIKIRYINNGNEVIKDLKEVLRKHGIK